MTTTTGLSGLYSCGVCLDDDEKHIGFMRESLPRITPFDTLRQRMMEDGYLLLRGLLEPSLVLEARRRVLEQLDAEGQLDPAFPLMNGVPKSGATLSFEPELAQKNNLPLQKLLYAPDGAMVRFFEELLRGPIRHFDFTWFRCLSPGRGTPSHCDIVYMGRGTRNLYTAWMPLGPTDFETGGLMILEGSQNHDRLRYTYGARDVDSYCENRANDPALTANGQNGWLGEDPNRIRRSLGGRWLVSEYEPGDAVVFCMDLVHGGMDNRSHRLRLSSDSRYQLASEPIDERWVGENPPGHSRAGKRGRIC